MTTLAAVYTVLNFLINEAQIFILVLQPAVYYPAGHTTERPLAVSFPGVGPITNNIINVANNNNMYSKVANCWWARYYSKVSHKAKCDTANNKLWWIK